MRLSRCSEEPAFPGFMNDRSVRYEVSGQCEKCSERWGRRRNKGKDYLRKVEFLRRFPVNARLIKEKLNFSEFLERKKSNVGFRLE